MKRHCSINRLRELFTLDAGEGILRRKISTAPNARVGDVAGWIWNGPTVQYRMVSINNIEYYVHVVIWAMVHGRWPKVGMDIAHYPDNNGLNNRISNLVEIPHRQNARHLRHRRVVGTSRFQGVGWHERARKWYACLTLNYCQIHIGLFTDERQAACAYDTAAILAFGEWIITNAKVNGWGYNPVKLSPRVIAKIKECGNLATAPKLYQEGVLS